ncbi:MAG: class I SAM-dependent methyltransferase [Treponema sp.]|nr:class I SAM-dependent methyltransferase [Treponema sp.]
MPVCPGQSVVIPCLCGGLDFKPALECEGFSFVRCSLCGLVQRNPQPLKAEIIERYSKTFGNDYLSYEIANEESFLNLQRLALKDSGFEKLEKNLFNAAKEDKPSVLDIGCATGSLLASLRDSGWRVTGVEISPCAGYARNVRAIDVRNTALEECGFPAGSFDVILASHLIEHLNDPGAFLGEVYRILKNGGYIFITTPNIDSFQAKLFAGKWRSAIFDHLYLFSKKTLSKLLLNAGFKIESRHTWGGLAAGSVPLWLKKPADKMAKIFGCGDVMIVRAIKREV